MLHAGNEKQQTAIKMANVGIGFIVITLVRCEGRQLMSFGCHLLKDCDASAEPTAIECNFPIELTLVIDTFTPC